MLPFIKRKEDIDLAVMQGILDELIQKIKGFTFRPLDLSNAEISYMATKGQSVLDIESGLWGEFRKQKYNIKERPKLRKDAKDYVRIIRKDGLIERMENYSGGELSSVRLVYYEDDKRYIVPFALEGFQYLSYTLVTHEKEGEIVEAYECADGQIIYTQYNRLNECETEISISNVVPKAERPILEHWYGSLIRKDKIEFVVHSSYLWYNDAHHSS